jgi:hypothetical protein
MGPDPQPPALTPASAAGEPRAQRARWLRFPRTWSEVRRLGWRMILAFILFYLVRDTLLYIVLPYLIYRGVVGR